MEFKKVVFNKLFLSGVVCGLSIAGCSIVGFQYGQDYAQGSYEQSNLNQGSEKTIKDLQRQLDDKNFELSSLEEDALTNKKDNEFVEQAKNTKDTNNFKHDESKVKPRYEGFVAVENQKVDIEWAPEFTNKLTDAFQLSDELYSLGIIKTIECKTTLCEIQFDLNSPGNFGVVFQIKDAFEQTELKNHGLVLDYLEKNNMVKLLIGRNDDSFEGIYQ